MDEPKTDPERGVAPALGAKTIFAVATAITKLWTASQNGLRKWLKDERATVHLQLAETIAACLAAVIAIPALLAAIFIGIWQSVLSGRQASISATQSIISNHQSALMQKQLDLESRLADKQALIATEQNKLMERQIRREETEASARAEPQVAIIRPPKGDGLAERLQIFNIGTETVTFLGFGIIEDEMVAYGVAGEGIELIPVAATLQKLFFPVDYSELEQEFISFLRPRTEKPAFVTVLFYFKDEKERLWTTPMHFKLQGRLDVDGFRDSYEVRNQAPRRRIEHLPKSVRTVD